MKLIKRLSASLTANLDSAVSQFENHEAIVAAAIKRTRRSIAQTKAQYNALLRQEQTLKNKHENAQSQAALWTERAKRFASENKEQALECVSRRNHHQRESTTLKAALQQQQDLLREVTRNLDQLEQRLSDMQQRHQLLRSRQSLAVASESLQSHSENDDLEATFERWEAVVLERDQCLHLVPDTLSADCERAENQADLEIQLSELIEREGKNHE